MNGKQLVSSFIAGAPGAATQSALQNRLMCGAMHGWLQC